MNRALASTSIAQLCLTLGACAVSPPDDSLSYRPGSGVVEAVQAARVAVPRPQGSSPLDHPFRPRWTEGHQLTLRMDDGTRQQVTQTSETFKAGDRVDITPDGRLLKEGTEKAARGYRAGTGVVEVARPARVVSTTESSSAAAGGTVIGSQAAGGRFGTPIERVFGSQSSSDAYQLIVKMDDGTRQVVTQPSDAFGPGDRVEVRPDGRVVRTP